MTEIETIYFFGIRGIIAMVAGLIMGIERERGGHSAGIKTIVLVSLGSSMFSASAFYLQTLYPGIDPTRIIGQIITGIGFLGAGVIMKNDSKISGLTSSAVIWIACAAGTLAGMGLVIVPIFAAITFIVIIYCLRKFENSFDLKDKSK